MTKYFEHLHPVCTFPVLCAGDWYDVGLYAPGDAAHICHGSSPVSVDAWRQT